MRSAETGIAVLVKESASKSDVAVLASVKVTVCRTCKYLAHAFCRAGSLVVRTVRVCVLHPHSL